MAKRQKHLVIQHLEDVSSDILEAHPRIINDYIKGRNGIYALYNAEKLYYVGLATNMRTRLKQHLNDRHSGLWNRFSLYITKGDQHLRALESLVLHIAKPEGNVQKMKLIQSADLALDLEKKIEHKQGQERAKMFGRKKKKSKVEKPKKRKAGEPALAPYVDERFNIRADYKGKRYTAKVRSNGLLYYAGKLYNSPSLAAMAIVKRSANGWNFWKYKNENGEWVWLQELRGKKKKSVGTKRVSTGIGAAVKNAIIKNPDITFEQALKIARRVNPKTQFSRFSLYSYKSKLRKEGKLKTKAGSKSSNISLSEYIAKHSKKHFRLRANYKGKRYIAEVYPSGRIKYDGKLYNTPSGAGKAVRGKLTNGWTFWRYQIEQGKWVKLDELRKK